MTTSSSSPSLLTPAATTAPIIPASPSKPLPFSRSPSVLAFIKAHFSLDGDTILKDGKPITGNLKDRKKGYYKVPIGSFNGRKVHWKRGRLVWFLATGEVPDELDHRDGNRANDALSNLRPCTRSQNSFNRKRRSDRRHGLSRGVEKRGNRFYAVGPNKEHLGSFLSEEAAAAVSKAEREKIAGAFVPGPTRYRRKHTTTTTTPKRRR